MTSGNELDTTVDDWRAEMEEFRKQENAPGKTVSELAKEFGIGHRAMQYRIIKMLQEGRCYMVGKAMRRAIDGRMFPIPVYRLTKKSKGKK